MSSKRILVLLVAAVALSVACGEEGESPPPSGPGAESCDTDPQTTDSGLVIQDLECGEGEEAEAGDSLEVHYTGTLENGKKFDSSRDTGQPFPFVLGQGNVIKGWDEGVVGMKVGGTRKLTIPPDLGYGSQGFPPTIPPDATLVFEIELITLTPA